MAAIVGRKGSISAYVGETETLTNKDRLPHIVSVTLPQSETEDVDVTDYDSEGKETEPGMTEYGELQINQHLNTDEYKRMQEYCDAATKIHWEVYVKNKQGEIVIGRKGVGTVKSVSIEGGEVGSAFSVSTTIKVSGKPTDTENEPAQGE